MKKTQVGTWRCEACRLGFRSLASFDMHRTGRYAPGKEKHTRRCLTREGMQAKGMEQQPNGAWVTGRPFSWAA